MVVQLTVPDRAPITGWLIELLSSGPEAIKAGDHQAPDGTDAPDRKSGTGYPYFVVYSIPGGGVGGPPLGGAEQDADFVYQVDSVGITREQSESTAARARHRVAGRLNSGAYAVTYADPANSRISGRMTDGAAGAPIPEGDFPNVVWTTSERFVIGVTIS